MLGQLWNLSAIYSSLQQMISNRDKESGSQGANPDRTR
jgi:hypothetical protein